MAIKAFSHITLGIAYGLYIPLAFKFCAHGRLSAVRCGSFAPKLGAVFCLLPSSVWQLMSLLISKNTCLVLTRILEMLR